VALSLICPSAGEVGTACGNEASVVQGLREGGEGGAVQRRVAGGGAVTGGLVMRWEEQGVRAGGASTWWRRTCVR